MDVDHLPSPPDTTPSRPLSQPIPLPTSTTPLPPLPTPSTTPSPTPTPIAQPPATTNTAPGARPNVSALLAHLPPPALRKVASFVSALAAHLPPQHPDSEPARRVIQLAYWDMVNDYQLARAHTCAAFRRGLAERDAVREEEKAAGWRVKRPTVMDRIRECASAARARCPKPKCSSKDKDNAGNCKDADAASIDSASAGASLLDEEDQYAGECARTRAIRRWCAGVRRACNTMCPDKDKLEKLATKDEDQERLLEEGGGDDKTPHAHMQHLRIDSAASPHAAAAAGGASPAGATGGSAHAEADERADEPMRCEDGYEHESDENNDQHHHDGDVVMSGEEHHMARKRRHCDTDMSRDAEVGDMTKRMCTNAEHVNMADCPPTPPVSVPATTPGGIDELKLVSALYACYVVNVATSVKHGVQRPRIVGLVKQMLAATSLRDMSAAVANAPAGGDRVPCPQQQQMLQQLQQPGCRGTAAVPDMSNPTHANTQHNLAFNPHPITQTTAQTTPNTTTTTQHAHPVRQLPAFPVPGVPTPAANLPVVI